MSAERYVPKDLARYAGVGVHFAATIGVFGYAGYWSDGRLGTQPICLLVGVFLGFGLGLRSLISKLGPKRATRPAAGTSDTPSQPSERRSND